jgi:hypothetical protein
MYNAGKVAAVRVLFEQYGISIEALAPAAGYVTRRLALLAEREGWQAPPPTIDESDARVTRALQKRLDQMLAEADMERTPAGHRAYTSDLLKLHNAVRAQRLSTTHTAVEQQERDDDELARIYQRLSDRTIALARSIAADVIAGRRTL